MDEASNERLVRDVLRAIEGGDEAAVAAALSPDATFTELPNRLKPKGETRGKSAMLEGLARSKSILSRQSFDVVDMIAHGSRVVAELRWSGVLAILIGSLKVGG